MNAATNITAVADKSEALRAYIIDHVMYRTTHIDQWNIPYAHLRFLDVFRSDGVMLGVSVVTLLGIALLARRRATDVPGGVANVMEAVLIFVRDRIAVPFLGARTGLRMTSYLTSLFFFIAVTNLLGLFPFFSTATSNINVTGALAAITLGMMIAGAMRIHGVVGFFRNLVPPGVPLLLKFLLFPIELISVFSKAFALTIRLFANMLAGHILIFALLGLFVTLGWIALPVLALVIAVFFFEIFVCLFQAYLFTMLSAMFIGQTLHPEH